MLQWPEIKLDGCRFNLSQAWWRAIQRFEFATDYTNEESEISKWLHYCFGLIYLNPEDVENCFNIDLYNIKPNDSRLDKFYDYLKNTNIDERATFPPKVWAEASSELTKSTNACESFHAHFNANCNHSHPNV